MSDLFNDDNDETFSDKINLDDLYSKKQQSDLNKLHVFNKILNRVHNKIKLTSRQHNSQQCCWYVVPEMILGVPPFDHASCITYIVEKLQDNGFIVKYTHPNLLFISWNHWIPGYVRNEIKKKTGITVDGFGNRVQKHSNQQGGNGGSMKQLTFQNNEPEDPNNLLFQHSKLKGKNNGDNGKKNGKNNQRKKQQGL
jgi:hypothetical protein